jgi:hypothetical protein
MRKNQAARRNLTDDQRVVNAARLVLLETEKSKRDRAKNGREKGGKATPEQIQDRLLDDVSSKRSDAKEKTEPRKRETPKRTQISKEYAVSERKVKNALEIEKADPDLLNKVEAGEITLAQAKKEIDGNSVEKKKQAIAEASKRHQARGE